MASCCKLQNCPCQILSFRASESHFLFPLLRLRSLQIDFRTARRSQEPSLLALRLKSRSYVSSPFHLSIFFYFDHTSIRVFAQIGGIKHDHAVIIAVFLEFRPKPFGLWKNRSFSRASLSKTLPVRVPFSKSLVLVQIYGFSLLRSTEIHEISRGIFFLWDLCAEKY